MFSLTYNLKTQIQVVYSNMDMDMDMDMDMAYSGTDTKSNTTITQNPGMRTCPYMQFSSEYTHISLILIYVLYCYSHARNLIVLK